MVYLKLEKELWIVLGLANYIPLEEAIVLDNNYYISYSQFSLFFVI